MNEITISRNSIFRPKPIKFIKLRTRHIHRKGTKRRRKKAEAEKRAAKKKKTKLKKKPLRHLKLSIFKFKTNKGHNSKKHLHVLLAFLILHYISNSHPIRQEKTEKVKKEKQIK